MPLNRPVFNDCPQVVAKTDIPEFSLVRFENDGGVLKAALCGDNADPHGVALETTAAGETVPVKPWALGQQVVCRTADAVSVGQTLYTAANGLVTDTDGGSDVARGIAATATSGTTAEQIGVLIIDPA